MKNFRNKPLGVRIVRGFILAIVVALVAIFTPTPFWIQAPGRVESVGPMITIDSKTFPAKGEFLLPTVVSEKATLLYCLYSLMESDALLTREKTIPQAQAPSEDPQMALSQYISSVVALEHLGHNIRDQLAGLRILEVSQDSPNRGTLMTGDILTELRGTKITSFSQFKATIDKLKHGEKIPASVLREGQNEALNLEVYHIKGRSHIGVMLKPELEASALPFTIKFAESSTSGASGGLVFALEIYNRLTPDDITGGRIVAATGTLDTNGTVGEIQGLRFKMIGAARAGSEIFLVPRANFDQLGQPPQSMKVIPVDSFKDALDELQSLP